MAASAAGAIEILLLLRYGNPNTPFLSKIYLFLISLIFRQKYVAKSCFV